MTEDTYIEAVSIESTYIRDDSTRVVSIKVDVDVSIKDIVIRFADCDVLLIEPSLSNGKGACIQLACGIDNCIKSTCFNSISTVEHSRIYLQSFWNLKVGDARLAIWVEDSCTYMNSYCISQNLELGGTRIEIWVKIGCTYIKIAYFCQNIEVRGTRLDPSRGRLYLYQECLLLSNHRYQGNNLISVKIDILLKMGIPLSK